MKSKVKETPSSRTGELVLILATAALAGVGMLGLGPLQAIFSQYGSYIWGAILLISVLALRGKPDLGMLLLIQAISLLMGFGLSLKDAKEVPYGLFGGFIWSGALLASFVFGLLYFAQNILPLTGNEGWSEGLRLMLRHCCLGVGPAPKADDEKGKKSESSDEEADKPELPASFAKLQAGILKSYEVLALNKGSGFARPAGPGFVILYRKEKIAGLIDLRHHARTRSVGASTRDGIPIQTELRVVFRVKQSESERPDDTVPHPYDRDAIFAVSYASSIDQEDKLRPWTERLCSRAAVMLVNELSLHALDELFQGDVEGIPVIETIKDRVKQKLERQSSEDGIEVLEVGLSQFILPEKVNQQSIKTWQADWKRRIQMQKATGDAEALRRISNARALSQIEIIENITQNIESVRKTGDSDLSKIIMLRMIETLERAVSDESIQLLVPHQVMTQLVVDSAEKLQALVERTTE